jgi:hypothetical protein
VSFESVNFPGYYLRHQHFRIRIDRDDGTELFRKDATFFRRGPLIGPGLPNGVTLESVNLEKHYIRHQNFQLWLAHPFGDPFQFAQDATFEAFEGFVTEPLPCGSPRVRPALPVPAGPVKVPTFLSASRLGQLTGTVDPLGLPLLNNTHKLHWFNSRVDGVDMGPSTSHKGKLHIFFGDVSGAGAGEDLVAGQLPSVNTFQLMPVLKPPPKHRPDDPPGPFDPFRTNGPFGVGLDRTPTGAFSYTVNRKHGEVTVPTPMVFVFAMVTDASNPDRGFPSNVLVSKEDPSQPGEYAVVFKFSHRKFWSASPTVVRNSEHPGLPSSVGDGLVILAGGLENSVHLAWMELDPDWGPKLSTVRYYTGTPGNPWSDPTGMSEGDARANPAQAFRHEGMAKTVVRLPPYFSTVSASWLPDAKRWIIMYSKGVFEQKNPQRQLPQLPIVARFGTNPWTWSGTVDVFDPCREQAYGRYMHWTGLDDIHIRVPPKIDVDPVKDPSDTWVISDTWALQRGHAYGAFIVDRFTRYELLNQNLNLVYLMSTFNPYQVHVMKTVLRLPRQ